MIKMKDQKERSMKKTIVVILLLLTLFGLAACGSTKTIEGAERDQIVSAAEPLADSIVNNLKTGDYAAFSQYFDQAMKDGMTEQGFNDLSTQFNTKLGDYQSRTVNSVQAVDKYNAVLYDMAFTNAPKVSMRLVLTKTDPPQITGLWFDAPELR
jgi:predicted small secreted protein